MIIIVFIKLKQRGSNRLCFRLNNIQFNKNNEFYFN